MIEAQHIKDYREQIFQFDFKETFKDIRLFGKITIKMHPKHYILCIFLCVIGHGVAGVNSEENHVSISYTCNGQDIDNITITNGDFTHVRVLTNSAGYCKPSPQDKDGTLACISDFKRNKQLNDSIKEVTFLYEDETNDDIIGGNNTQYYRLSCTEKATIKIAKMSPKNIWTTIPPNPVVLKIDIKEIPKLHILNDPMHIYVGQDITLEMTIDSQYQLLPQTCKAYRTDSDFNPYQFWENCKSADKAITNAKSWTQSEEQSKLQIKMFAFRFIETETLIIKCNTFVCPGKADPACAMTCINRRRRHSNNQLRQTNATVSIALKVSDRQIQDNGSQAVCPVWYVYTIGFGMIYWITSKTF